MEKRHVRKGKGEGRFAGTLTLPPGDTWNELDVSVSPGAG